MKKLALLSLVLGLSAMVPMTHAAESLAEAKPFQVKNQPAKAFDFEQFTSEIGESKGGKIELYRDGTLKVKTDIKGNLYKGVMPDYELKVSFLDEKGHKLYDESWDLDEVSLKNQDGWVSINDTSKVGYPSDIQFNHVAKVKVELKK